jgi:histidinol-phosphate aminotransferase
MKEVTVFEPASLVRPHIQDMPAYEPILPFEVLSQQLGKPAEELIKLDANENPYGMLPEVRQALAQMPYAHIYPDPQSRHLRQALSDYLGVPFENLIAGAGADELIDLLMRLLLETGDALINCPPTFGMYSFDGDLQRARVINVPRQADFSLDLPGIQSAVQRFQAKLVIIASPNNPDGSLLAPELVESLLELPAIIALDEAYIEFATANASWIAQVSQRQNLVVLRTFSKWAGLAGLRVGYGAFPGSLAPHLWKIKQPYNVSVAASTAALASLQHAERLQQTGRLLIAERQRLFEGLQSIPWLQAYPSQANFILCKVLNGDARALKQSMAAAGILVRFFDKPGLRDHIRISVGKPEHSDALLAQLRNYDVSDLEALRPLPTSISDTTRSIP